MLPVPVLEDNMQPSVSNKHGDVLTEIAGQGSLSPLTHLLGCGLWGIFPPLKNNPRLQVLQAGFLLLRQSAILPPQVKVLPEQPTHLLSRTAPFPYSLREFVPPPPNKFWAMDDNNFQILYQFWFRPELFWCR